MVDIQLVEEGQDREELVDAADRLISRLGAGLRVILLHALPGAGKTTLLSRLAARRGVAVHHGMPDDLSPKDSLVLVDLPETSSIALPGGDAPPCIVAARPEQIRDFSRLALYGEVKSVGNTDLFLPDDGSEAWRRSSGWPALYGHYRRAPEDDATVLAFLKSTVLPSLTSDLSALLQSVCSAHHGVVDNRLSETQRAGFTWLHPVVVRSPHGVWHLPDTPLSDLLRRAMQDEPQIPATARILYRGGEPDAAIRGLLAAGRRKSAVSLLQKGGGVMFGHRYGPHAARAVLDAFGEDNDPSVLALKAMTVMKAGQVGHAKRLLDAAMSDPAIARNVELRIARLLLQVYNDSAAVWTGSQSEYGALLAEIPPENSILRGSVYNIALDHQIEMGMTGEAEATATRALLHYREAEAPYLAFYIHVHLSLMHLMQGAVAKAEPYLDRAAEELAATPFDTPQDDRFLELLRAQVAYERGEPKAMADFAETAFEGFVYGELWPTIAEQALAFGAEALLQMRGVEAAMSYLEGWRVQMWRTRRFRLAVERREIMLLQTVRRWHEARTKLESMATRIGRVWIDSAGENLVDLRDAEDIMQALIWLRQHLFERPRDQILADRLSFLAANPNLTWRQSQIVKIWQAVSARRRGQVGDARHLLADALEHCTARQCLAPILEERPLVIGLLDDPRMAGGPMRHVKPPRQLRTGVVGQAPTGGLSRQELRALLLLVEGCSNKEIAHQMSVSLPTVKFHLKNLFRKLDVSDRRSAAMAARHAGIVET
ncbi:helix-turn-helix transcriptional regulator [Marivivens aquimaris]|uniref:helix-turn-helix transcriptional regulator n=1 Tax=Marivivens aquimaris TaxID=2774876 RepID=UPI0018812E31|nr:LuxR C-terminal-related transcriptional regulator [Marivivens aquimaris]